MLLNKFLTVKESSCRVYNRWTTCLDQRKELTVMDGWTNPYYRKASLLKNTVINNNITYVKFFVKIFRLAILIVDQESAQFLNPDSRVGNPNPESAKFSANFGI